MTFIKFGTPSNTSPKPVNLETWNLAHGYIWTISQKWRNKNVENGRGLGHVTLIKFVTPSSISPTRMVQLPAAAAIEYVAACCRTETRTRTKTRTKTKTPRSRDTAPSQPTSRYHSTSIRQNVSLIRYVLRRKILVWHWEIPNIILLSLTALTFHPLCRSWHNKLC